MALVTVKLEPDYEWDVTIFANKWSQVKDEIHGGKALMAKGKWQSERESLTAFSIRTESDMRAMMN